MKDTEAKAALPKGWSFLVDALFALFREHGVSDDKLVGVRAVLGWAIFYVGLLPLEQFNGTRDCIYNLQKVSHNSCVECGGRAVYHSVEGIPYCLEHFKILKGG